MSKNQVCSICNGPILKQSTDHSLCTTCVASLADDSDTDNWQAKTPARAVHDDGYHDDVAVVSQERTAAHVVTSDVDQESTRRRLQFDDAAAATTITLELPDQNLRDKLIEACNSKATSIELTVRYLSPRSPTPLSCILVDVKPDKGISPTSSQELAPRSHGKACVMCSAPIENWMSRCRPCYAKWQRDVNPSKGPGVCTSCNCATNHEWEKFCDTCFLNRRDKEEQGILPQRSTSTKRSSEPFTTPARRSATSTSSSAVMPNAVVSPPSTCVQCRGRCEQHWMTHCSSCFYSKKTKVSDA